MSGRATVGALAALLLLLAPAPSASPAAGPARYPVPAGHVTRFEFGGTAGYRFAVSVNDRGYVTVTARKGGAEAQYVATGRTDGLGGEAAFPGLGRVSFSFLPTGPERALPAFQGCDGTRSAQAGVMRGVVRFRGEGGYARARASRARAELQRWSAQRCRFLDPYRIGSGQWRVAQLSALRLRPPFPEFTATRFSARARPLRRRIEFTASVLGRRPGVRVFRRVSVAAPPPTFGVPEPRTAPENVVLRPPAPFRGEATLRRTPESTFVWEGSLRVAFPGTKELRLTGPSFILNYCALRGCLDQFPARSPFRRPR